MGESKSETVEEHNRARRRVSRIPVLRDPDHVLYIPMYTELNTPMTFQDPMSQGVTDSDEGVPKEGAE